VTLTHRTAIFAAMLLAPAACSRPAPAPATSTDDAALGPRHLAVRVPAALQITRAIDALSVTADAASFASTYVTVESARSVGVEREVLVFPQGQPRPAAGRRSVAPGTDFAAATDSWTTARDGIPVSGTLYTVEVRLVLFETDVPPTNGWDPHVGRYEVLWARTLSQSEE
jgi:hypothetical protein